MMRIASTISSTIVLLRSQIFIIFFNKRNLRKILQIFLNNGLIGLLHKFSGNSI